MFKLSNKLQYIPIVGFCSDASFLPRTFTPILSTYIQFRNTYIFKRRYPVKLYKKGVDRIRLKGRDYIYDLIEDTNVSKKPDVQVILKEYIEGLGSRGDVVTVKRNVAYNKLLIPGIADYASPEAIERSKLIKEKEKEVQNFSTLTALQTARYLESHVLSVVMNKETEWTIEPWHIRVSFRKAGIHVPDHCISLPLKPIYGPDANLEGKEFFVTITINNKEKVNVRCRIHHWSTNPADRLPHIDYHWLLESEPIFPEEADLLKKLSLQSSSKKKKNEVSSS